MRKWNEEVRGTGVYKKVARAQFVREYGEIDEIIGEEDMNNLVEWVFISELDECPYIGVQYEDGTLYVYGARVDREVRDIDEMEDYMKRS